MANKQSAREICLNLWYIVDDLGMVYRLLARAYLLEGNSDEKLQTLRLAAVNDYWIARAFEIPKRLHTHFVSNGGEKRMPVMPAATLDVVETISIFEEAIRTLQSDLPGFCPLDIPQQPLVCITPLMMGDDGSLVPHWTRTMEYGG